MTAIATRFLRRATAFAATLLCLYGPGANGQGTISVVDFQQRTVTLPEPAQRIVALAPHIVENVYSAGAGHKLVGVTSYSNYPESARQIPRVGDYQAWSLESVVALKPDLVLLWGSGNGLKSLHLLEQLDIPVYISEPRQLEDIARTIADVGILAGTREVGDAEARRIEAQFQSLAARYSHKQRLSVFYEIWNTPLQTINGDHLISNVLNLCGAQNAFADATSLAPRISLESVLFRNPQAIVAGGMGDLRPEWLDEWKAYPSLAATQNNALLFVHPDHIQRPTARILLGAKTLCEQLDKVRSQAPPR